MKRIGIAISVAALIGTPVASADTALFMSGTQSCLLHACAPTSTPSAGQMAGWLPGMFAGDTMVGVATPSQFWPLTGIGSESLSRSVTEGTASLDGVVQSTPGPKVVFGISQSAIVVTQEKINLLNDPNAPARDQLSFVVEANPNRPGHGVLDQVPLVAAVLGVPSTVPDTPYDTIDIARQYDGVADFPTQPWNLVADANALAGFAYLHGNYSHIDLSAVPPENVSTTTNSLGGTTTYYTVPTPNLPLLQPLRDLGVPKPIVDALNGPLKRIVDAGYAPRHSASHTGKAIPPRQGAGQHPTRGDHVQSQRHSSVKLARSQSTTRR